METIQVKPKFIHRGLFTAPCIQYKSELPKLLKDNIDREELEELFQKIEEFYNPKYELFFDAALSRALKNIPVYIIPFVNIVRGVSILKRNILELSVFEKEIQDYVQELSKQHYFHKRGLQINTSWQTEFARYGIIVQKKRITYHD